MDFERQNLARELREAPGFQPSQMTFFAWLGVTAYLTEEAFWTTLRFIASLPAGSGVVFDYVVTPESLGLVDRIGLKALMRRVAKTGEQFRLFLEPRALAGMLRELGFTRTEDLGRNEINARYFQERSHGLAIESASGRLLSARV